MTIDSQHAQHDQYPEDIPTVTLAERKTPVDRPEAERLTTAQDTAPGEAPAKRADPLATRSGGIDAAHFETGPSREPSLFAEDQLAKLRARWARVQAGFVDDPRDSVQRADGLVSDVVSELTAGFSAARSRLEQQWGRGEEATTEDLRVALKGYRHFFERLLAV